LEKYDATILWRCMDHLAFNCNFFAFLKLKIIKEIIVLIGEKKTAEEKVTNNTPILKARILKAREQPKIKKIEEEIIK